MTTQETQSDKTRDNAPFAGHTPGPWNYGLTMDGHSIYVIGEIPIAETFGEGRPQSEEQANARLIAAAPALLASHCALVAALEAWVNNEASTQECFKLSRKALSDAHNLTAGMEGGTR